MQFVDLQLTSGTLWGDRNVADHTMTSLPKTNVPSVAQFEELFSECEVELVTSFLVPHLKFTGKNGNRIFLPLSGYGVPQYDLGSKEERKKDAPREYLYHKVGNGFYRTSERRDYHNVVIAFYDECGYKVMITENTYKMSVRPVKQG